MKNNAAEGCGADNEETTKKQCKVFDACRACTFRELQEVEACQKTGFRMILNCTTKNNKDVIAEGYIDKSC